MLDSRSRRFSALDEYFFSWLTARAWGHRIFAIGVGYAPAESLLRDMAIQTGGACEFVSPQENMAEAIVRMFHRMRGAIAQNIRIDWGQEPVWQSSLPHYIYDGETVHAFALLKGQSSSAPAMSWEVDGETQSAVCERLEISESQDLLRLGRMRQMEESESDEEKLNLALKYQLVSELTSLILVYERPADDKLEGLPSIQQVPQMPAYGHGCLSTKSCISFVGDGMACMDWMEMDDPAEKNTSGGSHGGSSRVTSCDEIDRLLMPLVGDSQLYLTQVSMDELGNGVFSTKKELLEYILLFWHRHYLSVASMKEFMDRLFTSEKGEAIREFFALVDDDSSLESVQNMAVFLQWAFAKLNPGKTLDRHSMRIITATMKDGDETMAEMVPDFLDAWYANS